MVKKLLSFLRTRTPWKLLYRVGAGALALLILLASGFSFFGFLIFVAAFLGIYVSLLPERVSLRSSFWFLPILGAVAFSQLGVASPLTTAFVILLFTSLLFLAVGLAQFFFKNRSLAYRILHTGLLLAVFMVLFSFAETMTPLGETIWLLAAWAAVFLLSNEAFRSSGVTQRWLVLKTSAAVGLLAAELAWVMLFLPLGFLNGAAFLTLILLLLEGAIEAHFGGTLTLSFIFRELVIFVLFAAVILAASQWVI